jgi:putative transposase
LIVEFIRDHADHRDPGGLRWGVEPICTVLSQHGLPVAPSTYYEHLGKKPTARQQRDEYLLEQVRRVHGANYSVYGARKVWLKLNREGIEVARCTVERLMKAAGLVGAVRGKVKRTTIADPAAERARDLVNRNFAPACPDRLWVADITYVSTWSGWVYVGFVVDAYARRLLGWRCGASMTTQLVLDALEQAVWTRQRAGAALDSVVAHTDRGSHTSASATPSVWPRPASRPRSARSATASITRWPRR